MDVRFCLLMLDLQGVVIEVPSDPPEKFVDPIEGIVDRTVGEPDALLGVLPTRAKPGIECSEELIEVDSSPVI
jgi:hypothetical protein